VTLAHSDTNQLLEAAAAGSQSARGELLHRYRDRLLKMVDVRLDSRLAPRVDSSDVVQEVLIEADRRLNKYLQTRPLPFFAWLRQIAADQIGMTYRRHIGAARRTVHREEPAGLPDASAYELANRLLDSSAGPSARIKREEQCMRIRTALDRLPARDREILTLRYLEQLTPTEISTVLNVTPAAVKMRVLRAIQRLHELIHRGTQL
jgi:RNA polymerase sigma-70 factor (ECF subfamily)